MSYASFILYLVGFCLTFLFFGLSITSWSRRKCDVTRYDGAQEYKIKGIRYTVATPLKKARLCLVVLLCLSIGLIIFVSDFIVVAMIIVCCSLFGYVTLTLMGTYALIQKKQELDDPLSIRVKNGTCTCIQRQEVMYFERMRECIDWYTQLHPDLVGSMADVEEQFETLVRRAGGLISSEGEVGWCATIPRGASLVDGKVISKKALDNGSILIKIKTKSRYCDNVVVTIEYPRDVFQIDDIVPMIMTTRKRRYRGTKNRVVTHYDVFPKLINLRVLSDRQWNYHIISDRTFDHLRNLDMIEYNHIFNGEALQKF